MISKGSSFWHFAKVKPLQIHKLSKSVHSVQAINNQNGPTCFITVSRYSYNVAFKVKIVWQVTQTELCYFTKLVVIQCTV